MLFEVDCNGGGPELDGVRDPTAATGYSRRRPSASSVTERLRGQLTTQLRRLRNGALRRRLRMAPRLAPPTSRAPTAPMCTSAPLR